MIIKPSIRVPLKEKVSGRARSMRPPRGRMASPKAVRSAAFAAFGVGAVAGLGVVALSGQWWLLLVGAACIVAAWFYTGGKKPYGYLGLGELFVFVFFGLVAVGGTVLPWVEAAAALERSIPLAAAMASSSRSRPSLMAFIWALSL